jgi:cobalt/nickel transport system permease protein
MHIPDGYLSPSTCGVFYVASVPFWHVALKRMRRILDMRFVPLLSLCAAFSFIIMMFNLPLPGGTTGHAVGMGIAAIVLGPWAAMIAISIALFIQAIFFGDGGITAFGANAFNMAIVGSLVASAVYRFLSGRTPITSSRRVIAAGIAGYLALNVAALCAAIEFGIQPGLFQDANGAPLYAPYPLHIAIPAMLIGHLTIAGLAEMIITSGIVAWLQRAEPSLLRTPWSGAPSLPVDFLPVPPDRGTVLRPFWIGLAALLITTPLGLLAAGTAWGEWSGEDFKNPDARAEIAATSGNVIPPQEIPSGLERLSSFWTAPFPDYAPALLKSEALGYVLSGMMGTGIIVATGIAADRLLRRQKSTFHRS